MAFSTQMVKSCTYASLSLLTIQALFFALDRLLPDDGVTFTWPNLVLSFALNGFMYISCAFFTQLVRLDKPLSVWGIVWRVYATTFACFWLVAIGLAVLEVNYLIPSIEFTIVSWLSASLASYPALWLLFSTSRRSQIEWVTGVLRGSF